MMEHPLLEVAVAAHVLAAGCLFTYAVAGPGPHPHRASFPLRALVLIGALAVHAALAKHLYGHPPAGVASADGQLGAMVMYYGGDAVDLVLMTLLCLEWYRSVPLARCGPPGLRSQPARVSASLDGAPRDAAPAGTVPGAARADG
jgi:putative membrane protein